MHHEKGSNQLYCMIADVLHHYRGRMAIRPNAHVSAERLRKAVPLMWLLIGLTLTVFSSSQVFAQGKSDDFSDNSKDPAKWGTDIVKGRGKLNETNGRLEYTCGGGSGVSSPDRPWKLTRFPYNAPWEITINATNTTSPRM
jgi:hypothetical protein